MELVGRAESEDTPDGVVVVVVDGDPELDETREGTPVVDWPTRVAVGDKGDAGLAIVVRVGVSSEWGLEPFSGLSVSLGGENCAGTSAGSW